MDFDAYLDHLPALHTWDGGRTWNSGGFGKQHLEPLHRLLREKNLRRIVETGAGNSTLTFLFSQPEQVTSIAPDANLFNRIARFCAENGLDARPLRKIVGYSEWELPKLAERERGTIDFALIDGCHGWPAVFVDFFYVNQLLKPDGYLMIDDVHLHSVAELIRLLDEQPGFARMLELDKAVLYRKSPVEGLQWEWHRQPYLVRMSAQPIGWLARMRRWLKF